jgi:hypothetical protein
MLTEITECIFIQIQRTSKHLQNTCCERAKCSVISFRYTLEFHPKFLGILIRPLPELPRNHIRIVQRQIFSNIESLLQISCSAFLEVLCAQALVATVEAADVCFLSVKNYGTSVVVAH